MSKNNSCCSIIAYKKRPFIQLHGRVAFILHDEQSLAAIEPFKQDPKRPVVYMIENNQDRDPPLASSNRVYIEGFVEYDQIFDGIFPVPTLIRRHLLLTHILVCYENKTGFIK